MAWQKTTAASYRAVLQNIVEMATSKHISAVAINTAGTGYVVGDILTITHAGAAQDATVEVLTVGGSGDITSVTLRNMGAFSNRIATVAVNAGGTGYAVNDILQIQGGTYTQMGKAKVTSVSGGVVTGVSLFESGGAYSAAPGLTGASTVGIGPSTYAGNDDCTLDLTMTGLIGTTGISATGGTGSGATFNLTLTDTGWTAVRDKHDYSFNSVNDEKEVVLEGTVSSGDVPFLGFRSFTAIDGANTRYGILLAGMASHNPTLSFGSNLHFGPGAGTPGDSGHSYLPIINQSNDMWLSITGRRIITVVKNQGGSILSYQTIYMGLLNPYGTATENPWPMYISGSTSDYNVPPDAGTNNVTGPTEVVAPGTSPVWFFHPTTYTWTQVKNSSGTGEFQDYVVYPIGNPKVPSTTDPDFCAQSNAATIPAGIAKNDRTAATYQLRPTPMTGGDLFVLFPATLVRTPNIANNIETDVHGELDNIFWISASKDDGTKLTAEDTITQSGIRYRIFPNAHNTRRYSYFCMREF